MKKKLYINICASSDSFGVFAENCDGIYAAGDTVADAKADVLEAIRIIKENLPEEQWPEPIKGDFDIVWHYKTQSLGKELLATSL